MTFAERLFDAYVKFAALDGELEEVVDSWDLGGGRYEIEVGHDYYDQSVSIREAPPGTELTIPQVAKLAEMGFRMCWLTRTDGTESAVGLR